MKEEKHLFRKYHQLRIEICQHKLTNLIENSIMNTKFSNTSQEKVSIMQVYNRFDEDFFEENSQKFSKIHI